MGRTIRMPVYLASSSCPLPVVLANEVHYFLSQAPALAVHPDYRISLVHLDFATADAFAIKIELDVRMVGQQRHGDRTIREFIGDHPGGQALAEGIVVHPGLPDGDFLCFPGL